MKNRFQRSQLLYYSTIVCRILPVQVQPPRTRSSSFNEKESISSSPERRKFDSMDLMRVFSDAQAVPSFLGDLVSKPPACYCSSSQSSLGHRPRNQDQCIFLFSSNQSEAFRPLGVSNQFSSTPVCCKFPVSLTLPSTTKFLPDARARQFSVCSPRPWSQSWSCQASTLHSVFHGGPK